MSETSDKLKILLCNSYTLYLKTQNYHWHVKGPNFKSLHELFEQQYTELATAIDNIAERIRMLGEIAPASFHDFSKYRTLKDGNSNLASNDMLKELHTDHLLVVDLLNETLALVSNLNDEGTAALLSERTSAHEKMAWMLDSSLSV